jgi:hypothetical protein
LTTRWSTGLVCVELFPLHYCSPSPPPLPHRLMPWLLIRSVQLERIWSRFNRYIKVRGGPRIFPANTLNCLGISSCCGRINIPPTK